MQGKGIRQTGFVPSVYGLALVYERRSLPGGPQGFPGRPVEAFRPGNTKRRCGASSFFGRRTGEYRFTLGKPGASVKNHGGRSSQAAPFPTQCPVLFARRRCSARERGVFTAPVFCHRSGATYVSRTNWFQGIPTV